MNKERLNNLLEQAGLSKKELAKLLDINAQSVYAWESTHNAPYWIWSWLENYIKAKYFDAMMEIGKQLSEGRDLK